MIAIVHHIGFAYRRRSGKKMMGEGGTLSPLLVCGAGSVWSL
jgi:hypothetical protein